MSPDPDTPWVPRADVLVNADGEFVIKLEMVSMTKETLELTVEGQTLTVTGNRPDPDHPGSRYLVAELGRDQFQRVVVVPDEFDLQLAEATYSNGLLRVVIPRRPFRWDQRRADY